MCPVTPISQSYMPLADTSPKYWPRAWQAALGSRTTLIPTPFSHINGVFPIVRDINLTASESQESENFHFSQS